MIPPLWLFLRCCQHLSQLGLIRCKLVRWEEGDDKVGGRAGVRGLDGKRQDARKRSEMWGWATMCTVKTGHRYGKDDFHIVFFSSAHVIEI